MSTPQKGPVRLSHRWVFWRDKWEPSGVAAGEMVQSLLDLGEVDTARNFWNLFAANSVEALPEQCTLQVFKQHVKPEWEDPSNINGGHFRLMPIPESNASPSRLWYALLTCAIGDQFTLSTSICGIGFANKGSRKVISVWINTCDAAAVRTIQTELSNLTTDKFTTKFITHKDLSHQGFTAQQSCWHRRTKSAPSPFVTVDFDEDEELAQAAPAELKDRRRLPVTLDSHFFHSSSEAGALSAMEHEHLRSKSEGLVRDIVPTVHPFGIGHVPPPARVRQSPPPGGVERMDTEFNWSDPSNTDLRDSNSGVYPTAKAPTPMKEWADQWSPSLLNAAMQRTAPFAGTIGQNDGGQQSLSQHSSHSPSSGTQGSSQSRGLDASAPPFTSTANYGVPPPAERSPMSLSQTLQGSQHPTLSVPQMTLTVPPPHPQQGYIALGHPPYGYPTQPPPPPPHGHPQFLHPHAFTSPTHFVPPAHLSPSAYPTAQPLPYVIVRQAAYHAGTPNAAPPTAPATQGTGFKGSRTQTNPNMVPTRAGATAQPPRRESPPPQAKTQAPTPTPSTDPLNGSSESRRTQHTKSDSAPFVFNGWKFPAGLNRKERRRIMFGEDVVPSEYPGAVFVGADVPNGPVDE